MTAPQPYDDSFTLGPVPGGDILFEPPRHVGAEPTTPATAPAPGPDASASTPAPAPEHYRTPGTYAPPPPPPQARPPAWGPSRVNIPSTGGPPPVPPTTTGGREPSRWQPRPGSKRKVPRLVVVLAGLWVAAQIFGGIGSLFNGSPEDGSSTSSESVTWPAPPVQSQGPIIDGMQLVAHQGIPEPKEIMWRVVAPEGSARTYEVRHDGTFVRRVEVTGTAEIPQPYAPGRWELRMEQVQPYECFVNVDWAWVASLAEPGSGMASCLLDTAWLENAQH